ncbi:MAG: formylglycine-generating enzyme family protein [Gemmataceae bacterium]
MIPNYWISSSVVRMKFVAFFLVLLLSPLHRLSAQERITRKNSLGMTLVRLSAGEFRMGLADQGKLNRTHLFFSSDRTAFGELRPAHLVRLTRPIFVSAHEVTLGQFREFVKATGYQTDAERSGKGAHVFEPKSKNQIGRFVRKAKANWHNSGFPQKDDHPVTCVSWRDAVAFCDWLSKKEKTIYRLPTEAEWEYACRAGTSTLYSCGDDPDKVYAHANVADETLEKTYPREVLRQRADYKGKNDGYVFTSPVGHFQSNPWGLHDMHGNVWEWCQDRFSDKYYQNRVEKVGGKNWRRQRDLVVIDPQGPKTTSQHKYGDWRSLRGGSWYVSPFGCRCDYRGFAEAEDSFSYIGFRVVREVGR